MHGQTCVLRFPRTAAHAGVCVRRCDCAKRAGDNDNDILFAAIASSSSSTPIIRRTPDCRRHRCTKVLGKYNNVELLGRNRFALREFRASIQAKMPRITCVRHGSHMPSTHAPHVRVHWWNDSVRSAARISAFSCSHTPWLTLRWSSGIIFAS